MQTLTDNPAISAAAVEELIERFDEPTWLAEERRAAFRSYQATPFPTARDEQWRYSQLERFALDGLGLAAGPLSDIVPERISMRAGDSDAEGIQVIKNGKLVDRKAKITETGVIFTDLRSAIHEHQDLVRAHLFTTVNATQTKYTALNSALWTNGTFVYVPKNVEVELPLGTFTTADRGGIGAGRTLIVVDVNAKLTFIDEFTSEPFDERLLYDAATEIILKEGAKLRYVSLQNWSRNVVHLHKQRADVGRDARLESLTVSLGGDAGRVEIESELAGLGAESEMLGLYFADEGQHFNQYTVQHHASARAFSDVLFKGAVRDASNVVYSGIIIVDPGAQKTDAYQTNRNLLLDRDSQAVSIPQLEIAANDVKCSHGSTTGPVPEDQRFYLMSRGLTPEVAEHVLVTGFLYEVMKRVTLPKVAEYVGRVVQAKLGVPGVKEKL
ncbi:MAG TPA: Fe-S cluster assembly protein SufD [Trueperaceae bacterium]|nr:Fe-S cluster assembly protein SufD [Trueperaceae bacterium]